MSKRTRQFRIRVKPKNSPKMENVSLSSNHTITALTFVPCPGLPEFAQWRKEYLTPVVFYNSVAAITINGLLLPVIAIFNALIMVSILVDRQLRRNPFMIILLSLSTTDFLVGFLVQPIFIVGRVSELMGRLDLVCNARRLQTVIGVACIVASLGHTCLISVERYLAVRAPNRYRNILTSGRVVVIVLLIWLFTTTYAVLPYAGLLKSGTLIGRTVIVFILIASTATFYIGTLRETVTVFPRFVINPADSSASPSIPIHSRSQRAKPGQSKTNGRTSGNFLNDAPNSGLSPLSCDMRFLLLSTSGIRVDQTSRIEDKFTNSSADQFLSHNGNFHRPSTSGLRIDQPFRRENKSDKFTNKARTLGQLSAAPLRRKMREKKLAKTMLITVGFLALCYFPETIAYPLLPKRKEDMAVNWIVLGWTNIFLSFNSFINPFWYSWRIRALRKAVLKLVMRIVGEEFQVNLIRKYCP